MNEWYPEKEEEGDDDDKGMVHLEVVWEEVEVFSDFWLMSVTDTFFYMKIIWKKMKKNKTMILNLLCIIRSFLLNNLTSVLHQRDCIRCGEAYAIQESNSHSTITVTISSTTQLHKCRKLDNPQWLVSISELLCKRWLMKKKHGVLFSHLLFQSSRW